MIKIIGKIPNEVHIAFSGGSDSVAFTHYLLKGKRKVHLYYVNHNYSEDDHTQEKFVKDFALKFKCILHIHTIEEKYNQGSRENFWREHRYNYLYSIPKDIIVCHQLEDQIETYLLGAFKGQPKFIPYKTNNIVRPFLLTSKKAVNEYLTKHGLEYYQEQSNFDLTLQRNRLRHNILPQINLINPGLEKTIQNLLLKKLNFEI